MTFNIPTKTIRKTFKKYSTESKAELKELSKLKLMAVTGRYTHQKVFISIKKPECIEIRIYNLGNFSTDVYLDFNRKIKKLTQ